VEKPYSIINGYIVRKAIQMNKTLLFLLSVIFTSNVARSQTEVTFYTSMGNFVVETYDTLQPITAGNFLELVETEFYDGVIFHRVINNFMIQGGDPTGSGFGGPGYNIMDEFDPLTSNVQASISMANSGPNTGGSQFFINLVNNTYLDPNHPVFGIVTSNFSVVQNIGVVSTNSNDRPLTDVVMDSLRVTSVDPLGVNAVGDLSLNMSVFPNPTQSSMAIDMGDDFTFGTTYLLNVTNVLGETIYSAYLLQKQTSIDLSEYGRKGIYFVNVIDEQKNARAVRRVVLQ
jgi:peptidylprolyl isomerase